MMLPNKMKISERATNALRRLQSNTGLTANIGARLAFFTSLERGFRFDPETDSVEHTGRELDKHTWLGDHGIITEQLLKEAYPSFTKQQFHDAWVAHVDDGSKRIETVKNLTALSDT
ncbi:DNA sulfur modification protein DndE [Amphritea sp. 1_MG-2023]|uniref:DNA sulfur modification protein DndE n=1 Tax=Amphritea sp. 1_MG-2023 TaxID=3062670 RepID=UPI0026E1CF05|nr:DNA sulfur modification protein DndE [Amphritea sp. 1_MG-2023]MDO6562649.1 DNA sulfur modification protein DndE [Amphritea sp. 1_MG-2023]